MKTIPNMTVETIEVNMPNHPKNIRMFKSRLILEREDVSNTIETQIFDDHLEAFLLHCDKIKARMIQAAATF